MSESVFCIHDHIIGCTHTQILGDTTSLGITTYFKDLSDQETRFKRIDIKITFFNFLIYNCHQEYSSFIANRSLFVHQYHLRKY